MKRILFILCLTLCVLSLVTPVSATPIAQGDSVTWCFNTQSLEQGHKYSHVGYHTRFSGDLLDHGERIIWEWTDELYSAPLNTFDLTYTLESTNIFGALSPIHESPGSGWTADEDLYLTITMISGSVYVDPDPDIYGMDYNNDGFLTGELINPPLTGTSVPDASIMLLLGSSLMGLAVFSRKPKRS